MDLFLSYGTHNRGNFYEQQLELELQFERRVLALGVAYSLARGAYVPDWQ